MVAPLRRTVLRHPDGRPLAGLCLDAMGCLVTLRDPVPTLGATLAARGIDADPIAVARALRVEVTYYRAHHLEGRDPASLASLRSRCAAVFVTALADEVPAAARLAADEDMVPAFTDDRPAVPRLAADPDFVTAFVESLRFALLPGVEDELATLAAAGVPMVCVSNWDADLERHLTALGIAGRFRAIVASGAVGVAKPDPAIFTVALEALGLPAEAVAHLGDEPVDRDGAAAAGLAFLEPPVAGLAARPGC